MNPNNTPAEESISGPSSLALAVRVDRVCRWFEDEWNAGRRLRLEDCLDEFDESVRDALLVELIALEVELRLNAGESPVADEYTSRFPAAQWAVTLAFQDAIALGPLKAPLLDAVPDEHFGDFRIVCEIGRGGMGVVYEAVQESLGRRVALKTLPHRFDARDDRRRRFQREARAIGRLHHSNIVDVFGMGEHEGVSFIAMRLIDGVGLDGMIAACHKNTGQHSSTPQPIAEQHASLKPGVESPIPRAVIDEPSERGGVSPLVLRERAYAQEPGGLRHPTQRFLSDCPRGETTESVLSVIEPSARIGCLA